ncbi:MAG: SpoVR family protein, partial [Pseudomonadota bacterium]
MSAASETARPLIFDDAEWTFDRLDAAYEACAEVAFADLELDIYKNQIEIISSEQMLDAYSSHGMPLMYRHWSFGKHFARDETMYRKGYSGLAYEIVINSDPCISYLMEENSMTMQTLVMAHACFGHNHFFKNNYLFRQWTDAGSILGYLDFAKKYI